MWDERYGKPEYLYGMQPNDFLAQQHAHLPRGRVLSLADGEGRNGVFLAEQGHQVTSLDASRVAGDKARRLAEERGVSLEILHADLGDYEFEPAAWSGIVSIFCHLPPALRQRVHAGVVRGLAPGGVLLLEAYTPDQIGRGTGGPPNQELTLTLDELRRELGGLGGLEVIQGCELVREIHEGPGHRGAGAVVQLLARKPLA